jgi:coenzyme PQQ synthesis protein D (PqqD)
VASIAMMIEPDTRFRVTSDAVGAKVIDGEAIIVNVLTGRYHSIDGSGAIVWELLASGHNANEVSGQLAARYGVGLDAALSDVRRLAAELLEQELLVEDDGVSPSAIELSNGVQPTEYRPPELVTFSDIEELLALDPPAPLPDLAWKGAGEHGR